MIKLLNMLRPATKRKIETSVVWQDRRWTLTELAEQYNINRTTLYSRIVERGWSVARALEQPANNKRRTARRKPRCLYDYKGQEYSLTELCEMSGTTMSTLLSRIKKGMTVEQAVDTPVDKKKSRSRRRSRKNG